jgi:SAM-dependent methyltransferase
MFDVIEHLFHPREVLEGVRRVLAPNGLFVVTTPNFNALSRRALGAQWATLSPLEHMYYYTEATLRQMLETCGFIRVTFDRSDLNRMPVETMNYRATHAPHAWRAKAYEWFVERYGERLQDDILQRGLGDALLCLARTPV